MKKTFLTFLTAGTFVLGTTLLTSCGGNKEADEHHNNGDMHNHMESTDHHDKAVADENSYACPMHPETTGKKGDKCSECGMDMEIPEQKH